VGLRWQPERAQEVLLWVRDEGIGIAQSELSAIFACFYRSPSLDPALSGLGIGLYLVKDLVDRHGGRVWAESMPGSGSTFWLVLPLIPPAGYSSWSTQQEERQAP
jgi:signal transduction histidine kinase